MSKMYNWNADLDEPRRLPYLNLILFASAASLSLLLFLIFAPQIQKIIAEFPLLIEIAYFPTLIIGFIFGMKVTERAIKPSEIRSPIKRGIVKILLFFFIIGGLFSAVSFALGGGISIPAKSIFEMGLAPWATQFVTQNGGLTFLILSGISLSLRRSGRSSREAACPRAARARPRRRWRCGSSGRPGPAA